MTTALNGVHEAVHSDSFLNVPPTFNPSAWMGALGRGGFFRDDRAHALVPDMPKSRQARSSSQGEASSSDKTSSPDETWAMIDGNQPTNWEFVDKDSTRSHNDAGDGIDYVVKSERGFNALSALRSYNLVLASVTWLLLDKQKKWDSGDRVNGAQMSTSHIKRDDGSYSQTVQEAFWNARQIARQILEEPGNYHYNYANYMTGFKSGFYASFLGKPGTHEDSPYKSEQDNRMIGLGFDTGTMFGAHRQLSHKEVIEHSRVLSGFNHGQNEL